jgi:hypothetical protein
MAVGTGGPLEAFGCAHPQLREVGKRANRKHRSAVAAAFDCAQSPVDGLGNDGNCEHEERAERRGVDTHEDEQQRHKGHVERVKETVGKATNNPHGRHSN